MGLATCAAILCACIAPAAAGSGIPEVKAYLNGVDAHSILAPSTLFVKVGLSLSPVMFHIWMPTWVIEHPYQTDVGNFTLLVTIQISMLSFSGTADVLWEEESAGIQGRDGADSIGNKKWVSV